MNNIESQLYGAFQRMDAKKKRGRPPGPRGTKIKVSIRLTPEAYGFCVLHPESFGVLESALRKLPEFKKSQSKKIS